MAYLLKPGFLQTAKSAADVQKLMKNDLKNSAGKGGLKFFAAKNYEAAARRSTCSSSPMFPTPMKPSRRPSLPVPCGLKAFAMWTRTPARSK
jgi:hypothetical protein